MSKRGFLMRSVQRRAFTLIELLVVIAIIALLMAILMPTLSRAREQGKRAVCLSHLKSMQMSWIIYADENDGRIVNGNAGENWTGYSMDNCWVLTDYMDTLTYEQKRDAIMGGALYPYVNNIKSYHCPTGSIAKTELRMFTIMDSMNCKGWDDGALGPGSKMFKKRANIKDGARRAVFFDDGGTGGFTQGGWTVYTTTYRWWDPMPIRHGNGTTWSFADGHVEHQKYSDKRTIDLGRLALDRQYPGVGTDAGQGNEDNYLMRFWVWGQVAKRSG